MSQTTSKTVKAAGKKIAIDIIVGLLCVGVFYVTHYLIPSKASGDYTIISSAATTTAASTSTTNTNTQSTSANTSDTSNSETTEVSTTDVATSTTASKVTDWSEKFADKFTDTVVQTDSSYTSPDVSITIENVTTESGSSQISYYVADIYVADITCFQTALAKDTYGTGYKDTISNMASDNNAILATNGDYYSYSNEGIVIRNGVVYRSAQTDADVCVLYYDGTMKTFSGSEFDIDEAINDGAYQAWTFGPMLLDDSGNAITSFNASKRLQSKNPRTAIGYYEPGHYCLVTVDGRDDDSAGMTLTNLSNLFEELGCTSAYNLDGGKSSVMTYDGTVVNNPVNGGRQSSDCILIKEVTE
ncbi:uncharacterized protein DUF2233 [Lachnotalea glycerini]|uniref:Uncharacterized protein DUF2233 n=1 Tax=Lachnotalea glycerini TaxID=1763509 RepID=A0A318ET13_9FIRM|nr:phosphodiester glycosidase family protein [Lachnotalea glycerini]PXV91132.1 uncharacterized protein DUF2233 [Lachnotalea glycerini]